jgi:hypothetical protein
MITKNDALNLIDALNEWYEIVEPKELEKKDEGLNHERYNIISYKLHKIAYGKYAKIYTLKQIKKGLN